MYCIAVKVRRNTYQVAIKAASLEQTGAGREQEIVETLARVTTQDEDFSAVGGRPGIAQKH